MTHITITTKDQYEAKLTEADNDEDTVKESVENTIFTPSQIRGKAVITPDRTIETIGRVTEVSIDDGRATVKELFTGNEHTLVASQCPDRRGNNLTLTLPDIGTQHTVRWIEAKTHQGYDGWERVCDKVCEQNHYISDAKGMYDDIRHIKKQYVHNPHGYIRTPIYAYEGEVKIQKPRDEFLSPPEYDNIVHQITPPTNDGQKHIEIGSIYTTQKKVAGRNRKHAIRAVSVDELATGGSPVEISTPEFKQAAFKLGPV